MSLKNWVCPEVRRSEQNIKIKMAQSIISKTHVEQIFQTSALSQEALMLSAASIR